MQTGREHARSQEYEAAEACFGKAAEHYSQLWSTFDSPEPANEQHCKLADSYSDLLVKRAKNAWRLQQRVSFAALALPVGAMHYKGSCWFMR